jgi:hypothetical protein
MVGAWSNATKEGRRDMLRLMLDAVYLDFGTRKATALKPKPAFLPLFEIEGTKAGSLMSLHWRPRGDSGSLAANSPRYVLRSA